jgi:hypothetical protein
MSFFDFLFGKKKKGHEFPDDIKDKCFAAMNEAKICIEEVSGKKLKPLKSVKVTKKYCNKQINGFWCWKDPRTGGWVTGIAGSSFIQVGCSPTGSGVRFNTLKHEFGHIWIRQLGLTGHPSKFAKCFENWTSDIYVQSVVGEKDSDITIDFIEEK